MIRAQNIYIQVRWHKRNPRKHWGDDTADWTGMTLHDNKEQEQLEISGALILDIQASEMNVKLDVDRH